MARILCVDDEPDALRLKCTILGRAGHIATPASSASEALAYLRATPFDGIVMDWQLGEADAEKLLHSIKAISTSPVIVVSGYVSQAYQSSAPAADLYLEKPVDPKELITVIETLLKQSRAGVSLSR